MVWPILSTVYEINPLRDERWETFLDNHRLASIFHSAQWLASLQKTYGCQAAAVTTDPPGKPLTNAVVYCRVRSWATGPRLVSLPFSDHCSPLVESLEQLDGLLSGLKRACDSGAERHLEVRSGAIRSHAMADSASFCWRRLDLRPSLDDLRRGFHESCIRRKITRAQKEGLTYEEGVSEELLREFYGLTVLTRQRHQMAPQPLSWFRNLLASMGDRAKIRLARHRGQPAAAILTLRSNRAMTYKYGASDARFHSLGPMQLLFWRAIQEAKNNGLSEFDMGRTDWDNPGLLTFKDRWGTGRTTLTYLRYPAVSAQAAATFLKRMSKVIFRMTPTSLLPAAGSLLYRHFD